MCLSWSVCFEQEKNVFPQLGSKREFLLSCSLVAAFSKAYSVYYCFVTQYVFELYIVSFTLWSLAVAISILKYIYNLYFV